MLCLPLQLLEVFLRFLYGLPTSCPLSKVVILCALADQYDVAALQDATKGAEQGCALHVGWG